MSRLAQAVKPRLCAYLYRVTLDFDLAGIAGDETFDYDLLGNRNSYTDTRPDPDVSCSYTHNLANEYETVCGTAVSYDNAGNLAQDRFGYTYHYDYENRLVEIRKTNDTITVATFAYDALGRRIEKVDTIAGTTARFYYDDQRIVLQVGWHLQAPGLWVEDDSRTFIYGNYIDEVLVMSVIPAQAGIQDYYYAHDHLYSPVALFESDGDLAERYEYDVYGQMRHLNPDFTTFSGTEAGNPYYFTGRELDSFDCTPPAVGCTLYYYRARSYDPQTGRFLQRDPLGTTPTGRSNSFDVAKQYKDSTDLYEYVKSQPVKYLDPHGLTSCCGRNPRPKSGCGWFNEKWKCCEKNGIGNWYCPDSSCCEDGRAVAKVPIWECTRKLRNKIPYLYPVAHTFVCCQDPSTINPNDDPKNIPCFGKQPREYQYDPGGNIIDDPDWGFGPGYIEYEPYHDYSRCNMKMVCPSEKKRMCHRGPTNDPYWFPGIFIPGIGSNCHDWGNCRTY